ncbi:DMT family transporter [Marinovum sp.]|uniref:DMT family transporter n=1 Tax=Marinovum sp. TaxID=2024839 RepID=UPI002B2769BC|nr:DMT family transporter [Marinovum sp.]
MAFLHIPRPRTDAGRGIALMIGTMLLFSILDSCAKELTTRIGVPTTLWARYAGQTLVVLLLVLPRLGVTLRTRYPGLQLARSVCLFAATFCFFNGLSRIGLAENTAIMDLNPVLITLGGALFLGEKIGLRRALGIGAALIGALIIIRPGTEVFSPAAIFPLGAALFFSAYTLITRFVGRDEDAWTSLLYTAAFGGVVMTALLPVVGQMPTDAVSFGLIAVIGCVAAAGQLLLIRALQISEAGTLAPFTYCGLLFATLWGALIFSEYPDAATILGATIIVVSGLYVWYRETHAKPA